MTKTASMKQTTTNGTSSLIEEEQTLHPFTQLQAKDYYNIQFCDGNHSNNNNNNNNDNNNNNNNYYYYYYYALYYYYTLYYYCAFAIKIIKSALHFIII